MADEIPATGDAGASIHGGGVAAQRPPAPRPFPRPQAASAPTGTAGDKAPANPPPERPPLAHGTRVEHPSVGKGTYIGLARDAQTGELDGNTGLILPDGQSDPAAAKRAPLSEISPVLPPAKPVDPTKPEANAPASVEGTSGNQPEPEQPPKV